MPWQGGHGAWSPLDAELVEEEEVMRGRSGQVRPSRLAIEEEGRQSRQGPEEEAVAEGSIGMGCRATRRCDEDRGVCRGLEEGGRWARRGP